MNEEYAMKHNEVAYRSEEACAYEELSQEGVRYELERLDKATAVLEHLTRTLLEALGPVLGPERDTVDRDVVPTLARRASCDIAERISRTTGNLSSIGRRIEEIGSRVAL